MPITKHKTALEKVICKNLNTYECIYKIYCYDIKNFLSRLNITLTLRFTHSQAGNGSFITFKDIAFSKKFYPGTTIRINAQMETILHVLKSIKKPIIFLKGN
jgi:hypothetical protein